MLLFLTLDYIVVISFLAYEKDMSFIDMNTPLLQVVKNLCRMIEGGIL